MITYWFIYVSVNTLFYLIIGNAISVYKSMHCIIKVIERIILIRIEKFRVMGNDGMKCLV